MMAPTNMMEQLPSKKRKCLMVRKSTAPKVERTSLKNVPSNDMDTQTWSRPIKLMPLEQSNMSELIKLAKAAKAAKQARLLEEKRELEEAKAKAMNEMSIGEGTGTASTSLDVLDFETFVQNLFQSGHGSGYKQSEPAQQPEKPTLQVN
jgi:hypothetical protein